MKCLIILSAFIVIALADDPHGVKVAFKKCLPPRPEGEPKSGSPPPPHQGPPVELLKCAAKELSLIDADGNVNAEGIKVHVEHVQSDAEKVAEVVKACAVNQASGDDTVKQLWRCLTDQNIFERPKSHRHGSSESSSSESEEHTHHHHH